jgi:hypothetical protein
VGEEALVYIERASLGGRRCAEIINKTRNMIGKNKRKNI